MLPSLSYICYISGTLPHIGVLELGVSGDEHICAAWPLIEKVIASLSLVLGGDQLKAILIASCTNDEPEYYVSECFRTAMDESYAHPVVRGGQPQEPYFVSFQCHKYLGKDYHFHTTSAAVFLKVLGGITAALGAIALLLALALPSVAGALTGAAVLAAGYGLFKWGQSRPQVLSETPASTNGGAAVGGQYGPASQSI